MPYILSLVLAFQFFILLAQAPTAQAEAMRGSLFLSASANGPAVTSAAFKGRAEGSMFQPRSAYRPDFKNAPPYRGAHPNWTHQEYVKLIRDIIQEAESRRDGYDAVQHGARIKPAKRPTDMTLAEIFSWIDATPNQPHAIGRYQFIPSTLRHVVATVGAQPSQKFSPALQDQLADVLLLEAGLNRFRDGLLDQTGFMNNLAKIWAGLPNSTGRSHYHGYAGNKASVSWSRFETVMSKVSSQL